MLTLTALAAMVPVLGADVVVGGQRRQIFSDSIKREVCIFAIFNRILIRFFFKFKS